MEDLRYETKYSEDELTSDSSDELRDLKKEYELKVQKALERKREKKYSRSRHESETKDTTQVPNSPKKQEHENVNDGTKTEYNPNQIRGKKSPSINFTFPYQEISPQESSDFVNNLYQSYQTPHDKLDMENRMYEFKGLPVHKEYSTEDPLELYSHEHLRVRYISKSTLTDVLKGIKVLKIDKLLAKVFPPKFEEPNYANWVFIGIILKKNDPKQDKDGKKYLKISLGNFTRSIDVMFFNKAFDKNWKLKVGDLIAILNPQVSRFKPPFKGFNIVVSNDLNSVLEIGSVRDFGYCSATSSNGAKCRTAINTGKSKLCSYHLENQLRNSRNKRMELSGSVQLRSPRREGKKQSMYMGKNSRNSFIDFNTINEGSVFHSTRRGYPDKSKYHEPDILQKVRQKRRKIEDQKSNKLLEEKLLKLPSHTTFEKLGLVKKNIASDIASKDELTPVAYKPQTISKHGFNPALFSSNDRMEGHSERTSSSFQELKELGVKSKKSLAKAPDIISYKNKKWLDDKNAYDDYNRSVQISNYNSKEVTDMKNNNYDITYKDQMSSSDDELLIDFTNEEIKRNYSKMINKASS